MSEGAGGLGISKLREDREDCESRRPGRMAPWRGGRLAGAAAWIVASLCLLPMLAVALAAATGGTDTISHLWDTVLPSYAGTTLALAAMVGLGAAALGAGTAWLVVMTRFPGSRLLEIALVLPMAFPAYVLAYVYTFALDHPGFVQTALRSATGWGPRDYWFPEIRSTGGAAVMLSLVLYPYVYLLARAAFLQQSAGASLEARSLGKTRLGAFWRVDLPMARPAIAAGAALAVMETISDYGTVAHFGVPTFATGIYQSWFSMADRGAAAQLSACLLAFALTLVALERAQRGGARYHGTGGPAARIEAEPIAGAARWAATAFCAAPVILGFALPACALVAMGAFSGQDVLSPRYADLARNSVTLAAVAAAFTVCAAIVVGHHRRHRPGRAAAFAGYIARLGYAVPGGVVAVGLLVPFAGLDNAVDAWFRERFGISTGLLLTGSIWALVMAYMVRFMAAALGAYEGGLATVHQNMDAASRSLGKGPLATLGRIHVPILSPSILTALLIVFVDVMKELPATLILRPFNFDTLAVQAHRLAADERLEGAAVPSLAILAVGLVPVVLLCLQVRRSRGTGASWFARRASETVHGA